MCAGDVITAKIDQSNQCVREKILNPKDILALACALFSFCRGTVVNKFCFLVSFPVLVSKIEQNINYMFKDTLGFGNVFHISIN